MSGLTSLQEGKYSVYVIDWRKRELEQHNGNLKEVPAKVTLTVKQATSGLARARPAKGPAHPPCAGRRLN